MTYSLIPVPSSNPAADAPLIQGNFLAYGNAFAIDHSALNNADQGDHNKVTLLQTTNNFAAAPNTSVLFAKNATSAVNTTIQVFSRIPKFLPTAQDTTEATNTPIQLTYDQVNTVGPIYQSFLAGGYLIYCGSVLINGAGQATITLSPIPTKILTVLCNSTVNGPDGQPAVVSASITQPSTILIITNTLSAGTTYLWTAIAQA